MSIPFKVKAIYEYKSDYDDDLSFAVGQVISVTAVEDEDWYSGTYDGLSGMFPKNFVEVLQENTKVAEPIIPDIAAASPTAVEEGAGATVEPSNTGISQSPSDASATPAAMTEAKSETEEKAETGEETEEEIEEKPEPQARSESEAMPEIKSEAMPEIKTVPKVTPSSHVPMPGSLPSQRDDPYAIKKQFIGAGKSSYVPQVKPRDPPSMASTFKEVPKDTEIVREDTQKAEDEPQEQQMSLKERIGMLQKRQQEEAEREAAAVQRREERKKKAEEERRAKAAKDEESAATVAATKDEGEILHDPETAHTLDPPVVASSHSPHAEPIAAQNIESPEEFVEVSNESKTGDVVENGEEEDDDEELRRKKLVERMAKISGGRNMFGMMGMQTPFGGAPSKPAKTEPKPAPEEHDDEEQPAAPMKAIPIPGMVPAAVTKNKEDIVSASDIKESRKDIHDIEGHEIESHTKHELSAPPVPAREEPEEEALPIGQSLPDHIPEGEATGYEADEDISDLNVPSEQEKPLEANTSAPVSPIEREPPTESPLTKVESFSSSDESDSTTIKPSAHPGVLEADTETVQPPVPFGDVPSELPPPVPVPSHGGEVPAKPPSDHALPKGAPPIPAPASEAENDSSRGVPPIPTSQIESTAPTIPVPSPPRREKAPPPPPPTDSLQMSPEHQFHPSPALPSGPPPPVAANDAFDESVSDGPNFSETPHHFKPAEKSQTFSHPPPPSVPTSSVPRRTSTSGSMKRNSMDFHGRRSLDSSRAKSESDQATLHLKQVKEELDADEGSGWWIKNHVPDSLGAKLGSDLRFEVDEHRIVKRDGREVIYKDYYILFHDLSQIVIELMYLSDDPRRSVQVINLDTREEPHVRKDVLQDYSTKLGTVSSDVAQALIGSKVSGGLLREVFTKLKASFPNVILPIGEKGYGATIYKNSNGHVTQVDEIRAGDILCMKSAKFTSHKGLGGLGSKSITLGDGNEIYCAVVLEYDAKKEKVRVVETDRNGVARKEAYKFGEMKSGRARAFRIAETDCIGWA